MTDPLELFDRALAERPASHAPSEHERRRSRATALEAVREAGRRTPSRWQRWCPPLAAAAALAALWLLWWSWPEAPAEGRPDPVPGGPVAGGPDGPVAPTTPGWRVVHDDPGLLAAWRARPGVEAVVTVVVRDDAPLDRFQIDDRELDAWLRSVGLRPARIEVDGRVAVLDLLGE